MFGVITETLAEHTAITADNGLVGQVVFGQSLVSPRLEHPSPMISLPSDAREE